MPRPRDDRAHARILDAAKALLDEAGPGFSIADAAERAGVSRGTVYRRFGSHAGLLDALVSERGADAAAVARASARERVLDAVGELLRTRDFAGITVEDVAARAGVGVATLYRHLGDRDGMLVAFARERSPRRLAAALDVGDGSNLAGELRQLAATTLRFARDYPHLARLMLQPDKERAQRPAPLRAPPFERSSSTRLALERYLDRQVRAGRVRGDAVTLARLFIGMIIGAALLGDVTGEARGRSGARAAESIEDTAAAIADTFLHGCLSGERTRGTDRSGGRTRGKDHETSA